MRRFHGAWKARIRAKYVSLRGKLRKFDVVRLITGPLIPHPVDVLVWNVSRTPRGIGTLRMNEKRLCVGDVQAKEKLVCY